jgi:hypothetical protein
MGWIRCSRGGRHSCRRPPASPRSRWRRRACLWRGSAGPRLRTPRTRPSRCPANCGTPATRSRMGSSSSPISTTWSPAARTSTNAAAAGPRAIRHPRPARRRHPGPAYRGRPARPPVRGGHRRVDRAGRPAHVFRHQDRARARAKRSRAVRRRRAPRDRRREPPRRVVTQACHPGAHPAGQAGDRRVVCDPDARTVLGRLLCAHRAGLEHRQALLRVRRGQETSPGPGAAR